MADRIAQGLAFDEGECRNVISQAWSRYTGQPNATQSTNNWRAPGLFGLVQRRRQYLFKLPQADPTLPPEIGEFPRFQTDIIRQKHGELVSRLLENRFRVEASPASELQRDRARADAAERVVGYGAEQMQSHTGVDWQRALAQGLSAYWGGILHWRIDPDLVQPTPDAEYLDDLPTGDDAKAYQLTSEVVGGDTSKGKYRETATALAKRAKLAKARRPLPMHVEVVAPDQCAPIWDESSEPGPGIVVHIKEVGLIDYNGQLAKDGWKLNAKPNSAGGMSITLDEINPKSGVEMERPAPQSIDMPSIAGWKQRVSVAYLWTRTECYELVAPTLLTGSAQNLVDTTSWLLVKAAKHGYGRCPFVFAFGSIEENEWDPALRFRPALDGLYQMAPQYNWSRAMEMTIASQMAIKKYFGVQDVNAPPVMEGDEDGDSVILTKDSTQAQMLPPGMDIKAIGPDDISAAFIRSRELDGEELKGAAPQTGATDITATTQPWTARLGQSQANAYPVMLLKNIANALADMFRNWQELASKPVEDGGLGFGLYVPGQTGEGKSAKTDYSTAVGLEPDEWRGIWIDVVIDGVSSAERVTQIQLDLQLLNNPIPVSTPEMFVSDGMGVQDATGHMREVEAYQASLPWKPKLYQQELAKVWGDRVVVAAGGSLVGVDGQQVDPMSVLARNGIRPTNQPPGVGAPQPPPGMGAEPPPASAMPSLPSLQGGGAPPMQGLRS